MATDETTASALIEKAAKATHKALMHPNLSLPWEELLPETQQRWRDEVEPAVRVALHEAATAVEALDFSPALIASGSRLGLLREIRTRAVAAVRGLADGTPLPGAAMSAEQTGSFPAWWKWTAAVGHSRAHPAHVLAPYTADSGETEMDCADCDFDTADLTPGGSGVPVKAEKDRLTAEIARLTEQLDGPTTGSSDE